MVFVSRRPIVFVGKNLRVRSKACALRGKGEYVWRPRTWIARARISAKTRENAPRRRESAWRFSTMIVDDLRYVVKVVSVRLVIMVAAWRVPRWIVGLPKSAENEACVRKAMARVKPRTMTAKTRRFASSGGCVPPYMVVVESTRTRIVRKRFPVVRKVFVRSGEADAWPVRTVIVASRCYVKKTVGAERKRDVAFADKRGRRPPV
jgi:hypothetical protein